MILVLFLMLLMSPATLLESSPRYMIIWNVGQGAWTTFISGDDCWHFDAGGEYFPQDVEKLCRKKQNKLFISHDDWDHISFISRLSSWSHICLFEQPRKITSPRKQKVIARLPLCNSAMAVKEINWPVQGKSSNDLSRVYYLPQTQTLFPGDSSAAEEKWWAEKFQFLKVQWWILGHHGSQTSNSEKLIHFIGHPKAAISSARYKKYRHPHPLVQARLRQNGIPLLRTEDWGHLWIQI